jgi:hypothetical protein
MGENQMNRERKDANKMNTKRMSRKFITMISSILLMSAFIVTPVFADTNTNGSWDGGEDGKTDVIITIAPSYEVSIPASLEILAADTDYSGTESISKDSQIASDQTLNVKITTEEFKATATYGTSQTSTIPYSVYIGSTAVPTSGAINNVVLEKTGAEIGAFDDTDDNAKIEQTIKVKATTAQYETAAVANDHAGKITFTVSVDGNGDRSSS